MYLEFARKLRRDSTDAEAKVWRQLRSRQFGGAKFRRQHPLGPYILDFYCHEHSLVIEVDGGQHYDKDQARRDVERTSWLEARGLRILRFSNLEVLNEIESVLERIRLELEPGGPSLEPSARGRGTSLRYD